MYIIRKKGTNQFIGQWENPEHGSGYCLNDLDEFEYIFKYDNLETCKRDVNHPMYIDLFGELEPVKLTMKITEI